jgi:hypothetical protein
MCGQFFNSVKDLKDHIDKNHRITDSKMREAEEITNQEADNNNN